jgi:uncharacterized iron-regulated protein
MRIALCYILVMRLIALLLACLSSHGLQAQEIYALLRSNGKEINLSDFFTMALEKKVILFGELHNQPVIHWLQLKMVKGLPDDSAVGFEMLDIDNQQLLDDYSAGLASDRDLLQAMAVWSNFRNDYLPIIRVAHQRGLKIFASNAPTRLVRYTAKKGLDSLLAVKHSHPLLSFPFPTQEDLSEELYEFLRQKMPSNHNRSAMIEAQALRDASMAYHINKELVKHGKVLHIHGGFHSKGKKGITHFLKKYGVSEKRIFHIQTVVKNDCDSIIESILEEADITICIPEDSITSY